MKMNYVGALLGASFLCAAAGEDYSFEKGMEAQEKADGTVANAAVTSAREQLEKEKLEKESRMVKSRIVEAEEAVENAEKYGRFASKHKNILKSFSEKLMKAKKDFETSGKYKEWDAAYTKTVEEKEEAVRKAKEEVFGSKYHNIYL